TTETLAPSFRWTRPQALGASEERPLEVDSRNDPGRPPIFFRHCVKRTIGGHRSQPGCPYVPLSLVNGFSRETVHEGTAVNAARWLFSLPVLMRLVALGHVKWAILEWNLRSRQVTLEVGVRGTTLSSSLDPNETVIRAGVRPRSIGGRPSGDDS